MISRKRILHLAKNVDYKILRLKDGSLKIKVKVLLENKVKWLELAVFTSEKV